MKIIRYLAFLVVLCGCASATTVYISQSGGSVSCPPNGTQSTTAVGSVTWTAGNTYVACGTITSPVTINASGTSGNPITLTFATGGAITPSACSAGTGNACLSVAGGSYIVVDGGTACGWVAQAQVSCNGTVSNSTSEPSGSNFGIDATNCTNCEFRNLNIGPIYTKSSGGSEPTGDIRGIQAVSSAGSGTFLIHNNIAHDTSSAFVYVPSGGSDPGPTVYNNVTYNINSSLDISNNSNGTLVGVVVHDNHFGATGNWDNTGCPDHHNSMHEFAQGSGTNTGTYYYNNLIDGNWGSCPTGGLYFEGPSGNVYIFNNYWDPTYTQMNNGMVGLDGAGLTGSFRMYNNTIIGTSQSGDVGITLAGGSTQTIAMENNIISGFNTLLAGNGSANPTWGTVDYNTWGGNSSSTPWGTECSSGCTYYNFSGWQAVTGGETHSTFGASTSYVGVNSNGTLQSGSPAKGAGVNLTSLCSGSLVALCTDADGVSRPTGSTAWDEGWLQTSGSQATAPTCTPTSGNAPQSLTCTNLNTAPTVMCVALAPTIPASNGLGTLCATGTSLGTGSSEPYAVSSPGTYNFIAGTASLADSSVVSYTYTVPPLQLRGSVKLQGNVKVAP